MQTFWIEFETGGWPARGSVWNPAGERVWEQSVTDERIGRVTIDVVREPAGGLWRASGGVFTLDPRIPPYVAKSRDKWFDPEEK